MRKELITILACPHCRSSLKLEYGKKLSNRVFSGNLECLKCGSKFRIVEGIICFKPVTRIRKLKISLQKELKKEWLEHYQRQELAALKEEWKWMISRLNLNKSKIHLDWATGTGRFLRRILNRAKGSVVALEADYATCVWLVKFLKQIGKYSKVSVVCGDARKMPFKDDSYDSISSWHGLDEPNIKRGLYESNRVLKRGKTVAFSGFFIKESPKSLKLAARSKMEFIKEGRAHQYFKGLGFKYIDYREFFRGRWSEKSDFLPKFNDKYVVYGISGKK